MTPTGTERVIYGFGGGGDGERLYSGVTALHRKLYGATLLGGSGCGSSGCGTIYELSLSGKKRTLYTFTGGSDGAYPNGLVAVSNVLYGTTEGGGARSSGTIFSIEPSGTEKTLYTFQDNPTKWSRRGPNLLQREPLRPNQRWRDSRRRNGLQSRDVRN